MNDAPGATGSSVAASSTHVVLIPTYNAGGKLASTVREARAAWSPVWVVVDGSTDGSERAVVEMARTDPGLRVVVLPANRGKGAAVLDGIRAARSEGFTHVLTMDSDGQHPAGLIARFMRASQQAPEAMILGRPVFDESAPALRVNGRKISNFMAKLETLAFGDAGAIGDSLFGFRVYPIAALIGVMQRTRWMRRFDFDPEAAVRLAWAGVPAINLDANVRYPSAEDGGVSHFHYLRDNVLLAGMNARLMAGFVARLPTLVARRLAR